MREPVFRLLLNNRDPTENPNRSDQRTQMTIEPITGPKIESEGLTCLFYTNVTEPLDDAQEAIGNLIKMGFGWVVVPFYVTDHFIRTSLQLEPFYGDRWLRAYRLGR